MEKELLGKAVILEHLPQSQAFFASDEVLQNVFLVALQQSFLDKAGVTALREAHLCIELLVQGKVRQRTPYDLMLTHGPLNIHAVIPCLLSHLVVDAVYHLGIILIVEKKTGLIHSDHLAFRSAVYQSVFGTPIRHKKED
jgi:hypothetical protein